MTELQAYGGGLAEKHQIVALNKIDALDADMIEERRAELAAASGQDVHVISGVAGICVRDLTFALEKVILANRVREQQGDAVDESFQP